MRRVALLASLLLAASAGAARADRIAAVRDGGVALAGWAGPAPATGGARVEGVAFDPAGRLLLAVAGAGGETCDYVQGSRVVRLRDVRPGGIGEGGCSIRSDARGGLLATFSAGTLSSATVFRIDLARKRSTLAGPGYSPAITPDGKRLVTVVHAYYPGGGSYETLEIGRPGVPGSFTRIVPIPPRSADLRYASPSFAPDGTRIAAVRVTSTATASTSVLLVGRPGGPLAVAWRSLRPGAEIRRTAWSPDGRSVYFLLAGENAEQGNLLRLRVGERTPTIVLRRLADFDVAP